MDLCLYKRRKRQQECVHTEERPCEDTVRRLPYTCQEVFSPETNPDDTYILDFQPQKCEKINFYYLSHPICDTLLWQFKQTNMIPFTDKVLRKKNLIYEIGSKVYSCQGMKVVMTRRRHERDFWRTAGVLFLDLSGEYMSVTVVKIYGILDLWYVWFIKYYASI